ncbi:MAG: ATP-binding protein [Candidatus Njordarchaeota archaeon]
MYEEIICSLLRGWLRKMPPKDLIERKKFFSISDLLRKPRKIVSIVGPRRAGKTYFVYQLFKEIQSSGGTPVYFNFEDERIENDKAVLSDFLVAVKREFGDGNIYLLLDEVQRIQEWSRWLRRVYDGREYNILVTGSTSKLIGASLPHELGGRIISIIVFPLRFSEFVGFKNIYIDFTLAEHSEDERARLISLLEEYLRYGGLPEVVLSPDYKKILILQEYYRTVLSRDIARGEVRNIRLLDKFLKLIARSKQMSISKMYNALRGAGYRVGKGTLAEYLDRAKEAFFVYTIPAHYSSLKAKIQMPKKVYLTDTGYITALAPHADMGKLLENAVYLELYRRYWHDPRIEIAYWTDGRREVDFIVKSGNQVLEAIQVCYDISSPETKNREVNALIKAMKTLKTKNGVIITGYQREKLKKNGLNIHILPYWEWEKQGAPKYCVW